MQPEPNGFRAGTDPALNPFFGRIPPRRRAAAVHKKNGYLKKEVLRAAIPRGLVLAVAGAILAAWIDTGLLRRAFGLYLLWASVSIL